MRVLYSNLKAKSQREKPDSFSYAYTFLCTRFLPEINDYG